MNAQRSDAIDYGHFRERLKARTDRWSLLEEVLDEWDVPVRPKREPEFSPRAVALAEQRLGFRLPAALQEWYDLPFRFHRSWPLGGTQLIPASSDIEGFQLGIRDGFVTIHCDGDCCQWGFRDSDAGLPDPPIYNGLDMSFDAPGLADGLTWILQNESLSEWALHRTIRDALWVGRVTASARATSADEAASLLQGFRPLGLPIEPRYYQQLLGARDAIAVVCPDYWPAKARLRTAGIISGIISRAVWDDYWAPATAGSHFLVLYSRTDSVLEEIVSRNPTFWRVNEDENMTAAARRPDSPDNDVFTDKSSS